MYRALRARWNAKQKETESERERERERDAGRGRDACYETTARESPLKRGEERRGEKRRARWTGSLCERAFIFYLASSHPPLFTITAFLFLSLALSFSRVFHRFSPTHFPLPCSFRLSSLPPFPSNPFDFPLSSRRSPRAKIKEGERRKGENNKEEERGKEREGRKRDKGYEREKLRDGTEGKGHSTERKRGARGARARTHTHTRKREQEKSDRARNKKIQKTEREGGREGEIE